MASIFRIQDDGCPKQLEKTLCRDEAKDLQVILEKNHQLLPGDQINPEDPRRWFLVQREMPVPDPVTGIERWTVDFFFLDQNATPTFVECKRYADTRSRREVVGQVLEYAANGSFYWEKGHLIECAARTASGKGKTVEEAVSEFLQDDASDCNAFFENAIYNLKEGVVRIIFFLEEAPFELKNIVHFLNRQMEKSEILIVEAKQYKDGYSKIVVPFLYGYTEEARRVKRENTIQPQSKNRGMWNKSLFFEALQKNVSDLEYSSIISFVDRLEHAGALFRYGKGQTGSLGIVVPNITHNALILLWTNGTVQFQIGFARGSQRALDARHKLVEIASEMGMHLHENLERTFPMGEKSQLFTHLGEIENFVLEFL
ncbi:MAG: hypothetical protein RDU30_14765 [Desulfovibrionaceae bacterium]|nr:hypothetical protein [Desulfovibrionaceae bacterium]